MRLKSYSYLLTALVVAFTLCSSAISMAASGEGSAAPAGGRDFGLGIEFGEPTGFVAKLWRDRQTAFDFGLSYSYSSFVLLYGDYLIHFPGGFGHRDPFVAQLNPYVGAGPELFISTQSARAQQSFYTSSAVGFGIRIPLGIEWLAPKYPFGIFLEVVPGLGIIPGTFGFLEGGLGARFYF